MTGENMTLIYIKIKYITFTCSIRLKQTNNGLVIYEGNAKVSPCSYCTLMSRVSSHIRLATFGTKNCEWSGVSWRKMSNLQQ